MFIKRRVAQVASRSTPMSTSGDTLEDGDSCTGPCMQRQGRRMEKPFLGGREWSSRGPDTVAERRRQGRCGMLPESPRDDSCMWKQLVRGAVVIAVAGQSAQRQV